MNDYQQQDPVDLEDDEDMDFILPSEIGKITEFTESKSLKTYTINTESVVQFDDFLYSLSGCKEEVS